MNVNRSKFNQTIVVILSLSILILLITGCENIKKTNNKANNLNLEVEELVEEPSKLLEKTEENENLKIEESSEPSEILENSENENISNEMPDSSLLNDLDEPSSISTTQGTESVSKKEFDINEYVDEEIQAIVQSDDYETASMEKREKMICNLLSRLKEEKAINSFSFNDDLFSFEYCDGMLGGVMIKDFDSNFG